MNNNIYLFSTLLSLIIFLVLAFYSLKYRKSTGTIYFLMAMLLMAFLSLANVFEMVTPGLKQKLIWRNLEQIPLFLWPLLAYGLVWTFIGKDNKTIQRLLAIISLPMLIYFILIFTDQYHHLMRENVSLVSLGHFKVTHVTSTPLGLFFIAYMSIIGLIPLITLFLNLKHVSKMNKWQHFTIIMAILIPYTFSLLQVVVTLPISTPVSLVPSGILFFIGFFRHKLLRVEPIAKDIIIENMKEGIIVVDQNDIIVDANPPTNVILNTLTHSERTRYIGWTVYDVLQQHDDLYMLYDRKQHEEIELKLGKFYYLVNYIPIQIRKNYSGSLLIFTEITDRKAYEFYLYERATTDSLTNVYNRQYILEATDNSIADMSEKNSFLSFIILDIDQFKHINDIYGHQVGDYVLKGFADILVDMVDEHDVVSRVGGEEFAILLPEKTSDQAFKLAESIRTRVEMTKVVYSPGQDITYQVSIGVTTTNNPTITFKELYQHADRALYHSKNNGRNQTSIVN